MKFDSLRCFFQLILKLENEFFKKKISLGTIRERYVELDPKKHIQQCAPTDSEV